MWRAAESVPTHSAKLGFLWIRCDMACLDGTQESQRYWEKVVGEGLAQLWRLGEAEALFLGASLRGSWTIIVSRL